jgi:hypothetical protein
MAIVIDDADTPGHHTRSALGLRAITSGLSSSTLFTGEAGLLPSRPFHRRSLRHVWAAVDSNSIAWYLGAIDYEMPTLAMTFKPTTILYEILAQHWHDTLPSHRPQYTQPKQTDNEGSHITPNTTPPTTSGLKSQYHFPIAFRHRQPLSGQDGSIG